MRVDGGMLCVLGVGFGGYHGGVVGAVCHLRRGAYGDAEWGGECCHAGLQCCIGRYAAGDVDFFYLVFLCREEGFGGEDVDDGCLEFAGEGDAQAIGKWRSFFYAAADFAL